MFEFRQAIAEDVACLPAIERSAGQAFLSVPELAWIADDDVMSEASYTNYVQAGTAWVATESDRPVGFLSSESVTDELHIWQLAVDRGWQRKGIGKRLILLAIE